VLVKSVSMTLDEVSQSDPCCFRNLAITAMRYYRRFALYSCVSMALDEVSASVEVTQERSYTVPNAKY
jgi:hypothetical protein